MSVTSSQLLGAVIRLTKRETDMWAASPAVGSPAGASGSASSTNAEGVSEAKDAIDVEIRKVLQNGLGRRQQVLEALPAVLAGIRVLFKGLCAAAALKAVSPAVLAGSASLEALSVLQQAVCIPSEGLKALPCEALAASMPAIQRGSNEECASKMVALIEYFITEVCEKAWGVDDAWGDFEMSDLRRSPLYSAAKAGSASLVSLTLSKAKTVDVAEAAHSAFAAGHTDVFNLLIEDERCLASRSPREPLACVLMTELGMSPEGQKGQRQLMVEHFFRRQPAAAKDRWLRAGLWLRPLDVAVIQRNEVLAKLILHLAPETLAFDQREEMVAGKREVTAPTLKYALASPCAGIMRMLADTGAFEVGRYSSSALGGLSKARALFVACGFPLKPEYEEKYKREAAHRQDIFEVTDMVLAMPLPSFHAGTNVTLGSLFTDEKECIMEEESAIAFLHKCRASGLDIIHFEDKDRGKPHPFTLLHIAAMLGYNKLVDLAIELLGPESVDSWIDAPTRSEPVSVRCTALIMAISGERLDTALHLLQTHKAKAAYIGDAYDGVAQPLVFALRLEKDAAALPVVEELMRQDPLLCDLNSVPWDLDKPTAVMLCAENNTPRCLEALLSANLPGIRQLCALEQPVTHSVNPEGIPRLYTLTPAHMAATYANWDVLRLLLRYCPDLPVISPIRESELDGTFIQNLVSVEKLVADRNAPRLIRMQVEALARKQREEQQRKEKQKKVIATNSLIPSNAFEVSGSKVLTEAEEKRKAKKRAAKKKAKEKKRAAAAAEGKEGNAGAGKEADGGDSDSDSSGTDEEEAGLDDEERMIARAPTFDLEKEKAARKARAEAEAKASEGEKTGSITERG
jgi:hypothetical protein